MPLWIHRTTKQVLRSVASADLPEAKTNYIEEPDLSAVRGQPVKYWEISGDRVTLADEATRNAIDAAEVTARRDAIADELDQLETVLRAFAEVVLDEINTLRSAVVPPLSTRTLSQLKTAVRNKLNG